MNKAKQFVLSSVVVLTGLSSASAVDYKAPYTGSDSTAALWQMDSIRSKKYIDDASGADATIIVHPRSGGPEAVDPASTEGLDYPAGNPAFDKCLYMDGLDDGTSCSNDGLFIDPRNLRIEMWAKAEDVTNAPILFDRWGQIVLSIEKSKFTAWAFTASGVKYNHAYQKGLNTTEWNHYAVEVKDEAMTVFINGKVAGSFTVDGGLSEETSKNHTHLGSRYQGSRKFKGYIDEVRIGTIPSPAAAASSE